VSDALGRTNTFETSRTGSSGILITAASAIASACTAPPAPGLNPKGQYPFQAGRAVSLHGPSARRGEHEPAGSGWAPLSKVRVVSVDWGFAESSRVRMADRRYEGRIPVASRETGDRIRELDREIERYRKAATLTVEQLQWCVNYLYRLQRPKLAQSLERNRAQIIERAGLFS
jgi:hypothetical protein